MEYKNDKSEDVMYNLRVLPKDILVKEHDLLELVREMEELNLLLKNEEIRVYSEVENEVERDGKKVYSNKEKRDIETKFRLERLDSYKKQSDGLKDLDKKLKVSRIELEFMKRCFRASEVIMGCKL